MRIKKIIPLMSLSIDTKKNVIELTSDDLNILIKDLYFNTVENKFSKIVIFGRGINADMEPSTGNGNPTLVNTMVSLYNSLYKFRKNTRVLNSVLENVNKILKKEKEG